jgi:hypothetical protein
MNLESLLQIYNFEIKKPIQFFIKKIKKIMKC